MLILTRRIGEKILIGKDIIISVGKISGTQVSLGITAPAAIDIVREELLIRDAQFVRTKKSDSDAVLPHIKYKKRLYSHSVE